MSQWPQTEDAIAGSLHEALGTLPKVKVDVPRRPTGSEDLAGDRVLEISVGGRDFVLVLEIRKTVFPRDVRQVSDQMRGYSGQGGHRFGVLAAESISPGAKDLLRERELGYCDSGGSLFLSAPGLYILLDRPAPKSLKRTMRNLFSGRRAQAILALLSSGDAWVSVADLARRAGVSKPTVSQVMTELERQGLVDAQGAGPAKERRVGSPAKLLDTWVAQLPTLKKDQARRFFVPGLKSDRLAERVARVLEEGGVTFGLTGQAAAQHLAPFLSSFSVVAVRVLQSPAVEEAVALLGGREVEEGANLEVFATRSRDEFNFRERVDELWLLSPIQVYLDLMRNQGRSRELAEHLRRERIGF